jgi:hypothetical protein
MLLMRLVTDTSPDHGYRHQALPQDMREWHANAAMIAEKYKRAAAAENEVLGETGVEEQLLPSYDNPLWRVRVPVSRLAILSPYGYS